MRGSIPERNHRLTMDDTEIYDDVLRATYCGRDSRIFGGYLPGYVMRAARLTARTDSWTKPRRLTVGPLRDDPYIVWFWSGQRGDVPSQPPAA